MNKSQILQPPKAVLCPSNHPAVKLEFCKRCAAQFSSHRNIDIVFFCTNAGCFTAADIGKHGSHRVQRYSVTASMFVQAYSKFIEYVKLTNRVKFAQYFLQRNKPKTFSTEEISDVMMSMIKSAPVPPIYLSALRNKVSENSITFNDFASLEYRRFIVEHRFWEKHDSPAVATIVEEYIKTLFPAIKKPTPGPIFEIQIEPPVDLSAELKESKVRVAQLGREKLLTEFFLQVTACFNNEDIDKNLKECARIEDELGAGLTFLLRLGKLKALELHEDCSRRMKAVLAEVNSSLLSTREKELFFYYSAVAQWEYVQDPSAAKNAALFLDSRNKKHYRLQNPQNFVSFLGKAIDINKNPIYMAARALGYMSLGQHDRAAADFEAAQRYAYSSDAMDSNSLLNTLKRQQEPREEILTQQLHNRKTEYIMGLCKVLEKKRRHRDLRRCCEELVNREPKNLAFRVSLLKALLKLKDTDAARHQLSQIKDLKELPSSEVEEFERRIQLLRAYEQEELGNYSDAEGKLEHAARAGQPSASYWFNYAAFLFKHRNQRENNEKALAAVNRALEIRRKDEYLELKYLLLFMMGNLQEASKIQAGLKDAKFNVMKEYVDGNL